MNNTEIRELERHLPEGLGHAVSGDSMDALLRSARRERAEHVAGQFADFVTWLAGVGAGMRVIARACTAARMRTEFGVRPALKP